MARIDEAKRLLLISNSTLYGSGYLDHAEREIRDFLGNTARVIFVPFAVHDLRVYAAKAQERFRDMGFVLTSIHDVSNKARAIDEADVVFVGGVKNDQGAVGGFGERTGKNDFSTVARFGGQAQVLLAERRATGDKVIDNFVKQGVVVHPVGPFRRA